MSILPIGLRCERIRVLIVGGGPVAERKARAFAACGASVTVVAPTITDAIRDLHTSRVECRDREYRASDLNDVQLVVVATDDERVNATVAADAAKAGKLVNRADDPASGDFDTLAVHRAGDLAIGVSAGGVPAAAARIRDAIAARFDERYARVLGELADRRAAALARSDADAWRELSTRLLNEDFCSHVEAGRMWEGGEWR